MKKQIVIIGAGLTGLSLAYFLKKAGKEVLLLEKSNRTGGVINTMNEDGFIYETGPSTGVLSSSELAELFSSITDRCKPEIAGNDSKRRYILKKNHWEALPGGLFAAIKTPLFTWYDKFRILGEPFRRKACYPDEPVASMVVRRLGKSYLDYAVDPFVSGVYAGDPWQLITRHALPKLYALEDNHGGFIRGTIALHKNVKKQPPKSHANHPTREVFSVNGGLKNLVEVLADEIGVENCIIGCDNMVTEFKNGEYQINFTNSAGQSVEIGTSVLVTTVGGYALPELLPYIDKSLTDTLADTTYSPVIHAAVGYKHWTGVKLDGFGGLIPARENRRILGVLYPSAIFSGRAPEGGAMLSVFMGGIKNREMINLPDEEIIAILKEEIRLTMKTTNEPDLIRIHKHKHAIAQYDIKSEARFNAIDKIEKEFPGLIIAGSMSGGIGMADRVKQAKEVVKRVALFTDRDL
jgi:oxygen-dependent protoporphyrinogen oxidase